MKVILLRYGELFLKGRNQKFFKKTLFQNIKEALTNEDYILENYDSRYIIKTQNIESVLQKLKFVFGLVSFSVAEELDTNANEIENYIKKIKIETGTFRVSVNRANKNFEYNSIKYEKILGGLVLENNPHIKVSLKNYNVNINIDIRKAKTYVYYESIAGAGGLPLKTAGRGLVLLSGGIDSPVASYQMAKRGLYLEMLHFHSHPYTSEKAKQKVIKLAKIMSKFNPKIKLHTVNIAHLQEEINKNCSNSYMITIMRRFMMRIAEIIANERNIDAIVTGENLGQVASQTVESLSMTNLSQTGKIIFRPLISFDKNEIIKIAQNIGTYETSILPYEDCCTVFLPKDPIIKPKLKEVLYQESKLDYENLLNACLQTHETIDIDFA